MSDKNNINKKQDNNDRNSCVGYGVAFGLIGGTTFSTIVVIIFEFPLIWMLGPSFGMLIGIVIGSMMDEIKKDKKNKKQMQLHKGIRVESLLQCLNFNTIHKQSLNKSHNTDRRTDNVSEFKKAAKQEEISNLDFKGKKKNQQPTITTDSSDKNFPIKNDLNFPALKQAFPHDIELIEEIELNILDMSQSDYIIVSGVKKSQNIIQSALARLTYWHLEQLLRKMKENTSEIRNPKSWLQATIFNKAFENEFSNQNRVNFMLYKKQRKIEIILFAR